MPLETADMGWDWSLPNGFWPSMALALPTKIRGRNAIVLSCGLHQSLFKVYLSLELSPF
jgi:hypothetical protein